MADLFTLVPGIDEVVVLDVEGPLVEPDGAPRRCGSSRVGRRRRRDPAAEFVCHGMAA